MPIMVVLAVGLDAAFLETQREALQSDGYFVTAVPSLRDAIERFREGDWDLVVLGQSIPAERRERLATTIRAMGSRVPIVCGAESSIGFAAPQVAARGNGQADGLWDIGEFLANRGKKPVARMGIDSERLRRLAG